MWNAISKFLGVSANSDDEADTDTFEAASILEDLSSDENAEVKEFDGIVTSLHAAYGLINNEVFFNESCVPGGCLPAVGTKVHVVAIRKGAVGGWRAKQVYTNIVGDFVECDDIEESMGNEMYEPNTLDFKQSISAVSLQHTRNHTKQMWHQLLTDKKDIRISGSCDFGKVVLGYHASTSITITCVIV